MDQLAKCCSCSNINPQHQKLLQSITLKAQKLQLFWKLLCLAPLFSTHFSHIYKQTIGGDEADLGIDSFLGT
jgi:hypothetical protein